MNPPCLHCGHDYEAHETKGAAVGAFYCRKCKALNDYRLECKAYVKVKS